MSKKTIMIVSASATSLHKFLFQLIKDLKAANLNVFICVPYVSEEKDFFDVLKELGVSVSFVALNNTGINPIADLVSLYRLYQQMKSINPDFVFSYAIKPIIYGGMAAKLAKVPHVYSMITGLGYTFIGSSFRAKCIGWMTKRLYAVVLRFSQNVFFQNRDDLNLFISQRLVSSNKTVLINGLGVDVDFYQPVALPERRVFLFAGRLMKDKGILEYVAAARIIKDQYSDVRFLIAGGIHDNPSSIDQATLSSWIEEGIVEYLGYLDNLKKALAKSTVLVLPSYREGMPTVILEAMSMGRAVITTNAPGCREAVEDDVNGYLVPIKNVDALAEAMKKLIQNPQKIAQMGEEGRRIAEMKYDVRKVNRLILNTMRIIKE